MGKYYQAIKREPPKGIFFRNGTRAASQTQELHAAAAEVVVNSAPLVPQPYLPETPGSLARAASLRNLSERVAPQAAVDRSTRLLVSGCRPGEGTSTIAAALAIDLSQRLNMRTLVVDANLRSPTLHRVFEHPGRKSPALVLNGALQIQSTAWPKLDLASCCFDGDDCQREDSMQQLEALMASYPAAIVDLGVVRLDARTLPLARATDPIVLVVRYGLTERTELSTTAASLRAANRAVAGVILNGAAPTSSRSAWRIFRQ